MYKRLLVVFLALWVIPAQGESLRDPTQPPQGARAASAPAADVTSSMTLDSVLFSDQRRVAVINGQALREGDPIQGAQVIHIRPDRVELRVNNTTRTLRLGSGQSVRQSSQ